MKPEKKISVRKATLHNAQENVRCLDVAFAPHRDSYTPEAFADTVRSEKTIGKGFAEMRILVATDSSERVLGSIAYEAENRELRCRSMTLDTDETVGEQFAFMREMIFGRRERKAPSSARLFARTEKSLDVLLPETIRVQAAGQDARGHNVN